MPPAHNFPPGFQSQFHQRWGGLSDRHVRALAWLLCAPDLLDAAAPQWQGRIAALSALPLPDLDAWLHDLDRHPAALHRHLAAQPIVRLGRYAEKLMAFCLAQCGVLVAHGVQVRSRDDGTVGEFDFLLKLHERLVHWEFATKFYLLAASGHGNDADYFIGPNLADTLGAKTRKIFERQLKLSAHPSAQVHLPEPVSAAQALVKGWLFYREGEDGQLPGTSPMHCRGFWRPMSEIDMVTGERYAVLPRLDWLAPARLPIAQALDRHSLRDALAAHFAGERMPVLIAVLDVAGEAALEADRGFIVPDDWRARADAQHGSTRP